MLNVVDAVTTHRVCPGGCFGNLPTEARVLGIAAAYKLDDALRGWGYTPIYDVHGDRLFREAQQRNDSSYRGVAVRFGECIYRRLLGSLVHECLHAVCGDVEQANYGYLFGLPYSVPIDVPEKDEEAYLDKFNFGEARAWVGVWIIARGPEGRKLEERARAWFDAPGNLADVIARIEEAAAIGEKKRPRKYPDAATVARIAPRKIGKNEPCVCGSAQKFKDCCAVRGTLESFLPSIAR